MINEHIDLPAIQAALVTEQAALDAKRAAVAAEARKRLETNHREVCRQCREAEDALKLIESQMQDARRETVRAAGEVENCKRHVQDWLGMKPGTNFTNAVSGATQYHTAQFPKPTEIDAWQTELDTRQQAASEAQKADTEAWGEYEKCRFAWHKARDVFNALVDKEQKARNDLILDAGKPRLLIQDLSGRGVTMS
jgi:Tfp pilus assembly protein PilX